MTFADMHAPRTLCLRRTLCATTLLAAAFAFTSFLGVAGVVHADSLGTNIIGFPAGTCTGSTVGTLNCTSSGSFGTASAGATGSVAAGTLGTSATFNIQAPSNGQEGASILSEADLDYTFRCPQVPMGNQCYFRSQFREQTP